MKAPPMMKCGHAANAQDDSGNPACAICAMIVPGWNEVDDIPPTLDGRTAVCTSCGREAASSRTLAFFRHQPDLQTDTYYCGDRGWD